MQEGAIFAKELSDESSASRYSQAGKDIEEVLERFWDADKNYLLATIDEVGHKHVPKTSWLDTANVLAVLHAGKFSGKWTVTNDKVLVTHVAIVDSMR